MKRKMQYSFYPKGQADPEQQPEYLNFGIVLKGEFEEYLKLLEYIRSSPLKLIFKKKSLSFLWIKVGGGERRSNGK